MIRRKIAAHYLFSRHTLLKWPIVSLTDSGRIADIGFGDERIDSREGVEFFSGILIPDFVNAHCHLELSYLKGAIPEKSGFTGFAKAIGQVRGRFDESKRTLAIRAADNRMWRDGVGAVADICNGETTFSTKADSRMKYVNLLELFGLQTTSAKPMLEIEQHAKASGLKCGLTPHSTYSLSNAAFAAAVREDDDTPLSIHFMESPSEKELYERRGELWNWYGERGCQVDFLGYGSPARRIVECVPADRKILLIHNCCVEEEDVEMINARFGSRATWVLCPCSNDYISGLEPPLEMLRRKGVRIALGTDSLASNRQLSMMEEMKRIKGVPLTEILDWATGSGAEALGMGDELGTVEVGRHSGLVLLKGIDYRTMSLTKESRSERIF